MDAGSGVHEQNRTNVLKTVYKRDPGVYNTNRTYFLNKCIKGTHIGL